MTALSRIIAFSSPFVPAVVGSSRCFWLVRFKHLMGRHFVHPRSERGIMLPYRRLQYSSQGEHIAVVDSAVVRSQIAFLLLLPAPPQQIVGGTRKTTSRALQTQSETDKHREP